jgi:hypothetical protein
MMRIHGFSLCFCLLIAIGISAEIGRAQTDLWDMRRSGAVDRGLLLGRNEFRHDRLIDICRRVLATSKEALTKLVILTDAERRFDLVERDHVPFEIWARDVNRASTTPISAAEMIAIRGNAVLRIRDGVSTRRILLSDVDPLVYRLSGSVCEVLHIAVTSKLFPFQVFARCSGVVSLRDCTVFFEALETALPTPEIYLVVRNDRWFYFDPGFPAHYWFDVGVPPDLQRLDSSLQVICARYDPARPVCSGTRLND